MTIVPDANLIISMINKAKHLLYSPNGEKGIKILLKGLLIVCAAHSDIFTADLLIPYLDLCCVLISSLNPSTPQQSSLLKKACSSIKYLIGYNQISKVILSNKSE